MPTSNRRLLLAAVLSLLGGGIAAPLCFVSAVAEEPPASEGWRSLFNGKDFTGWKLRNPNAQKTWVICDDVRLDPANPARLRPVGAGGTPHAAMLCGGDGRGSD